MQTPSHISLALAVLGRKGKPQYNAAIIWGALTPDLSMVALFAYDRLRGLTPREIFSERYFEPLWQNVVSFTHSIPLALIILAVGYWYASKKSMYFALAALLHNLFDLPLHRHDAHMHFWPISNYKLISPVSYYETQHYGHYWAPVELAIIVITSIIGVNVLATRWGKIAFAVLMICMALMQGFMVYRQQTGGGF